MGLVRGGALTAGRSFFDNVSNAARIVPLNQYGNFGSKSRKKGSHARVFESSNPARTAYEFQSAAARGYVAMTKIRYGQVMTMSDGTVITYRMRSSSRDHTPVVELKVHNMPSVKSQKIHFIPRGQMSEDNYTITDAKIGLLRSIVGKTLEALEAVIVARDDMAWGTVRIHAGDASVDVTTTLRDLPINDEGDTEEFSVLAVTKAGPDTLRIDGVDKESSWCDIGTAVSGLTLVNGHVTATEDGTVIMERTYTQAIVLTLAGGGCLVLDKGAWFSEMITIGMGDSWEGLVYDDSQDWKDDPEEPEVHYRWQRSTQRI